MIQKTRKTRISMTRNNAVIID